MVLEHLGEGARPRAGSASRRTGSITSSPAINLSWAQELATYMFVWMAKFGAALGVRTGIHVGVDVLVNRLAPAARKPVIVFALLCGALFTGVIGTLGAIYVYELDADQESPGARMAELDDLSVHSARLLPDVLPLSAGGLALSAQRLSAASGSRPGSNTRARRELPRRLRSRPDDQHRRPNAGAPAAARDRSSRR